MRVLAIAGVMLLSSGLVPALAEDVGASRHSPQTVPVQPERTPQQSEQSRQQERESRSAAVGGQNSAMTIERGAGTS